MSRVGMHFPDRKGLGLIGGQPKAARIRKKKTRRRRRLMGVGGRGATRRGNESSHQDVEGHHTRPQNPLQFQDVLKHMYENDEFVVMVAETLLMLEKYQGRQTATGIYIYILYIYRIYMYIYIYIYILDGGRRYICHSASDEGNPDDLCIGHKIHACSDVTNIVGATVQVDCCNREASNK